MRRWRSGLLIALACLLASASSIFIVYNLLSRTEQNRDAIRVSCQLLANAIVQSGGASGAGPNGHRPPQQELTILRISVLDRAMTPSERRRAQRLRSLIASSGSPQLTIPDCAKIALHPESVRAPVVRAPGR